MSGGFRIPGYFDNGIFDGNKIKENRVFVSVLYVYKDHCLYEPGLFGKKVLVFKKDGIFEPGILGKKLFKVNKHGEVLENKVFGRCVGAIPPSWVYDENVKNDVERTPLSTQSNNLYRHERDDFETNQIKNELGYVADFTNTNDETKTIVIPSEFIKLTAVSPILQKRIETIKIGENITIVNPQSIGCLNEFIVGAKNQYLCSENGILYNKEKTKLIKAPRKIDLSSIKFPDSLIEIGEHAFSGCHIKKIIIPQTVKSIGNKAFSCCFSLKEIFIPSIVSIVGKDAFEYTNLVIKTDLSYAPEGWDKSVNNVKKIIWSSSYN